jgi:outer membrane protein
MQPAIQQVRKMSFSFSFSLWVSASLLLFATAGSAQSPASGQGVLELSLEKAIEIATSPKGNTTLEMAHESEQLAHWRYAQARAGLLPNLDGSVAEQNQTVNLRALGVRSEPDLALTFPEEVGPFSTFDARLRLNQNLFNFSSIRRWQAAQEDVHAAQAETETVRQGQAATVARLYAVALRAEADVEASQASAAYAEAHRDLATNRQSVGEGTDLEVTRAQLNVARVQQRLLAAETARTRANLDLISALNLDWNTTLHLTGSLADAPTETFTPEEAVAVALAARAEFKVQEKRSQSAKLGYSAAKGERLPSLVGYADYGVLSGVQTHTAGAALRLPLFDGGRLESDRAQNLSLIHQEEIRERELRNRVELEIRQALATLRSTEQQVQVAEHAVALAGDELESARRRYASGVTNSLEVIDAQNELEKARSDRVSSWFDRAIARIDLAQAMGTIMKFR